MLQTQADRIIAFFGPALPGHGRHLFNAEAATRHRDSVYRYEFGYLGGVTCYAVIEKNDHSSIAEVEALGFRVLAGGSGEWQLWPALPRNADIRDPSLDLSWVYQPAKKDDRIIRLLLCQHQQERRQLILFDPVWRPSLSEIAKKRL